MHFSHSHKVYLISLMMLFMIGSFGISQKATAQMNSAELYAQIKKMGVVGSVLYIAAHPDDENNSFLPYLTKDRMYRTGYLSLTRGDGGQNLIGKEQGIELGMIRTQELLAARKQDGAEQYFSRAYEFGFSKSSDEALRIWDRQQVLSDAVWVIRKFQPDIIITRFPRDARAGHGHHSASAIIANEAFIAAGDPTQFPEQFKYGVTPWKAKRILWNTFNFGSTNTTSENQLKIEVGGYNSIIGKSYGEIGAEARTMHKSQGEGRPRRRGTSYEYFETTGGEAPTNDIMDGVNLNWSRFQSSTIQSSIQSILSKYDFEKPSASIPELIKLYQSISKLPSSVWTKYKLEQLSQIIQQSAGIFIEATTSIQQVYPGSTLPMQLFLNQRSNVSSQLVKVIFPGKDSTVSKKLEWNQNVQIDYNIPVSTQQMISQPYWLVEPKLEGMFVVKDQALIGKAENDPVFECTVQLNIENQPIDFTIPVQYKYTDPTKGDVYQPIAVIPMQEIKYEKEVYLMNQGKPVTIRYQNIQHPGGNQWVSQPMNKASDPLPTPANALYRKSIQYDHIPAITYFPPATTQLMNVTVQKVGTRIGYFDGAGDKLPEALIELGYQVTLLKESDLSIERLKTFDAIVVGIRAYNMYDYLTNNNDIINQYIEQGGNFIVQYLKSNQVGNQKIKVGPYAFMVNSVKRVTQEEVPVTFSLPQHAVLNFPNKITDADFEHWVQERTTYQAENIDPHFEMPLTMNDKGETPSNGSLLVAPYGKGNMVYVSLTLFRQLPAANPGAYKLLANIVSLPKH
jgi:LmbE family N-acetylglucosaminyl deacetylase